MSDLIEQLRSPDADGTIPCWHAAEAADEIERLRRELAEARGLADALRIAALNADWHDFDALIARLRGEDER